MRGGGRKSVLMRRCGDGSGGGGGSGGGPKYVISKMKMLEKKHTYGQETLTSTSLGLFFIWWW